MAIILFTQGGPMPDMQAIQQQVQERLNELGELMDQLNHEADQLRKIAGMLEDTQGRAVEIAKPTNSVRRAPVRRNSRPVAATKPASRTRGPRGGNRGQQALELIAAKPGLTAAELAESMGMKRNYLYRVLPALQKDGKIAKEGTGYHPVGAGAASQA
jgi:predicted HTH transcriptional regulator